MKINKQTGFSVIEGLLIIIVVAILGFTGWFVWNSVKNTNLTNDKSVSDSAPSNTAAKKISTYDECTKAGGSKIQETYPQICVTKQGKHFTQPTGNSSGQSNKSNTQKYLVLKEWGVKIPLSADTLDAQYSLDSSGFAHISTKQLASIASTIGGCHPGIDDIYASRSESKPSGTYQWGPIEIKGHFYYSGYIAEPQCLSRDVNANTAQKAQAIQNSLIDDLRKLSAN